MIKPLLSLSLALTLLIPATNIDSQIKTKESQLSKSKQEQKSLSQKLENVGGQIVKEQNVLNEIKSDIDSLSHIIQTNQKELATKKQELLDLETSQKGLLKKKRGIEQDIIEILAKDLSFSLVINQTKMAYVEDLVNEEIFHSLSTITQKNIKNLKAAHKKVGDEIAIAEESIKNLKRYIQESNEKKRKLTLLESKKSKVIASLDAKKRNYKKRLEKIINEQKSLNTLLASLNIKKQEAIKKAELEKKREEAARKKQLAAQKAKSQNKTSTQNSQVAVADDEDIDVRKIGSSYTNVKTTRYRGRKTIPPLEKFEVVKKFGPYYDPVYKIKVFNESITLRSKDDNAKVKNVMDGRVVFAKDTPMLSNVVIVEHPGEMHTIYAHLDKIAPTIKQGRKIKKGYTIGRIRDSLMFEVTKKNYHIDPLDMIAMR